MEALRIEWERQKSLLQDYSIISIYFGGGTPFLLGSEAISEIISWVTSGSSVSQPEVTLEANPENITKERMLAYAEAGVNRVSIGLQTLDDQLLKILGRTHSGKEGISAVYSTLEAGIRNISIDLMYDLPYQTIEIWKKTLHAVKQLPITHLSLYNLTIEPHTAFFKYRDQLRQHLPSEEVSSEMYERVKDELQLEQYEISAFAKEGYSSRHNVGYWIGRPFLGYGPSAFSYWEKKRFRNVANLSQYSKALKSDSSPIDFVEELAPKERRRELLTIQLRMLSGVDIAHFEKENGRLDEETKIALNHLCEKGFLQVESQRYRLTKSGVLFYDTVAVELI